MSWKSTLQHDFGGVRAAQTLPDGFIDDPVVWHGGFPAHAAEQAEGFHGRFCGQPYRFVIPDVLYADEPITLHHYRREHLARDRTVHLPAKEVQRRMQTLTKRLENL